MPASNGLRRACRRVRASWRPRQAGDSVAQLCVHFEPDVISLQRIRELAMSLGARVDSDFGHLSLDVDGVSGWPLRNCSNSGCVAPGVVEAHVSATGSVRVESITWTGPRSRPSGSCLSVPGHRHAPACPEPPKRPRWANPSSDPRPRLKPSKRGSIMIRSFDGVFRGAQRTDLRHSRILDTGGGLPASD